MASGSDRLTVHLVAQGLADDPAGEQAKVTAFSGSLVTVSWKGGSYQFPYLSSYAPAVNDQVAMIRFAGSWLIIGKPVGFPA